MTTDDIARVHSFYSAAERNDMDYLLELLHPAVRWQAPEPLPYGGTHDGHNGFRNYRKGVKQSFEPGYTFGIEHSFQCGEQVIVVGRLSGQAKATGLPLASGFAHVWTMNDEGRVVARHYHVDTAALLAAFTGEGQLDDGAALEVVMGVYDATRRGDREAVVALLDPAVEWRIPDELPYGGSFKGSEGVMRSRSIASEHFAPGQRFTPKDVFRCAERIVGVGSMEAVVARTGQPLEAPFVHVWKVAGGKVVARRQYTDTRAILAALG